MKLIQHQNTVSEIHKLKRTVWVWACHKCRIIVPEDEASVTGWNPSEGEPPRCPFCDGHLARMRLDKAEARKYGTGDLSYEDYIEIKGAYNDYLFLRGSQGRKGFFGQFCDRILELCNHAFSTMYAKIFKQYWHTNMISRVKRNYCSTDWKEGIYEVYIPTQEHTHWNMQYYHIIVKVVPEMDAEVVKAELGKLEKGQITPAGIKDSELIVFIAPHRSKRERLLNTKFRGFRHIRKPGYLTAIIITQWPEQAFKRLLTLVGNFLDKRVARLREKMKLFFCKYIANNELYYRNIIENYSPSITATLNCLSHSLDWIIKCLRNVFREVGRQNVLKTQIKPMIKGIEEVLRIFVETPAYIHNENIPNPPVIKKLLMVFPVERVKWF